MFLDPDISRFGLYATDVLQLRPAAFDPELPEVNFETLTAAA